MKLDRSIKDAHEGAVLAARFDNSGDGLLTGGLDKVIRFWDAETTKCRGSYKGHCGKVNELATTSDASLFFSCGGVGEIFSWDLERSEVICEVRVHKGEVNAVRSWQRGAGAVSAGSDCKVFGLDGRSGQNQKILELNSSVMSLCLTSTNIIAGCFDGMVHQIDPRMCSKLKSHDLKSSVTYMCLDEKEKSVLASCMDSTLRLLDLNGSEILHEYKGHQCKSSKVECGFYNQRRYVVAGSEDGKIFFWNTLTGQVSRSEPLEAHSSAVTSLAVHPSKLIVTASANGRKHYGGTPGTYQFVFHINRKRF